MRKMLPIVAASLLVACTTSFAPAPTTTEELATAQAEWTARYGERFDPKRPNDVPLIPIRVIPPEELDHNQPEARARRAKLCQERGPEDYKWCE